MKDSTEEWQWHWGDRYSETLKVDIALSQTIRALIEDGKFGEIVVNIGSGKNCPITDMISYTGAKIVAVDVAAHENQSTSNRLFIRASVEDLIQTTSRATRLALKRVANFIESSQQECDGPREVADSFIFSEILNYVDYRKVLNASAEWLKNGGRFLIVNQPDRGFSKLFSEKRPAGNKEVLEHLNSLGFEIEFKEFIMTLPVLGATYDEKIMILVVRKT